MSDASLLRSPQLADRGRSRLLIIDVQQKLVPAVQRGQDVVRRITFLMNGAQQLDIPVVISEQYPQGLGSTVEEVSDHPAAGSVFSKTRFSAAENFCREIGLASEVAADAPGGRDQVILAGIESHVCVLQTAMDLLARGFQVLVAQDACSSGLPQDHDIGMARMRDAGVILSSAEGVVFEWCATADAAEFRTLSKLVRELRV